MNAAATIALAPLSLAYGLAVEIRSALYRNGILKTHHVSVPVISVGNITTGGTGKTPLVEWIARNLADRGARVCVLTRGYRRANPAQRVLVSDGRRILSDVEQSGDEAMMLAQSLLKTAAVVCDADRVAGAQWAIENLNADLLILDDGFQHLRIGRVLDIVTIDATSPWGNRWLLPAGPLRERVSSLRRADCIVVTRADTAPVLSQQIRKTTDSPIFTSRTAMTRMISLNSAELPRDPETILKQPIAAFCGIGNPKAFFDQLRDEGFDLRQSEAFRDHHKYSQADIERLTRRAVDKGAQALITTAKDAVKLLSMRFSLPCYFAEIDIEITESDQFLMLIDAAIQTRHSQRKN